MNLKLDEKDLFGARIKAYEADESARILIPGRPVYVRLDGRSFSTFTRGMQRPYDPKLSWIMVQVAKELAKEFKTDLAYTQSDEISLGWENIDSETEFMFGGRIQKLITVMAGVASAKFNQLCLQLGGTYRERALKHVPSFDARIFQPPTVLELMNAFVWRELDGRRNAISMAAQSRYSHKALQGVQSNGMLGMMLDDGVDYHTYYPAFFRVGTYIQRKVVTRPVPDGVPANYRARYGDFYTRSSYTRMRNPPTTTKDRMMTWFRKSYLDAA